MHTAFVMVSCCLINGSFWNVRFSAIFKSEQVSRQEFKNTLHLMNIKIFVIFHSFSIVFVTVSIHKSSEIQTIICFDPTKIEWIGKLFTIYLPFWGFGFVIRTHEQSLSKWKTNTKTVRKKLKLWKVSSTKALEQISCLISHSVKFSFSLNVASRNFVHEHWVPYHFCFRQKHQNRLPIMGSEFFFVKFSLACNHYRKKTKETGGELAIQRVEKIEILSRSY